MNIIIALLATIVLIDLLRLYWTYSPLSEKNYFKQKLEGNRKMIYDFSFKLAKTQMIREEIREQYDNIKSRIASYGETIKNKEMPEGDRKNIEDEKVRAEVEAKRLEAQMKNLDQEMYGAKPTNENPEGVSGITFHIDSLREVSEMLQEHINSL